MVQIARDRPKYGNTGRQKIKLEAKKAQIDQKTKIGLNNERDKRQTKKSNGISG